MAGGGITELLNISRSSIFAQSQTIQVIGNNVANVNTPGYSRRQTELVNRVTSSAGANVFGAGVDINKVIRHVDNFLTTELNAKVRDRAESGARNEILARAETAFPLTGGAGTIGYELSEFFSSLEDLAANPSQIPLRTQVISQGNALTNAISSTYNTLAGLQREADNRIEFLVADVNRLSAEIATLNGQITASEIGDQQNLALRDQRDKALKDLSEKIGVTTVENSQGAVLVQLSNGFGLVTGNTSNDLEFSRGPSFAPVGGYPPGLDGSSMGFIVFDFDRTATVSHVDLTNLVAAGGGEIGGLLRVRGIQADTDTSTFDAQGDLVEIASRVEAIARDLLTRFNETYVGPDEDSSTAGVVEPSSGDLNGLPPEVFGLFTFTGAVDSDADGVATTADLIASNVSSFASIIQFAISQPSRVAAALDLDPADGSTSFAPGDSSNIQALLNLRDDPVAYSVGNFSGTSTIEELYGLTVAYAGGVKRTAQNEHQIRVEREKQVEQLNASVSGVSLDEEFASLINYQRAYEASARMIKLGDELLNEIVQLL
jgi:flagellar hook-associated protein 1 FlgK